jgi:DNA helicase-2/ATP-dependent DNA helicase PcrA
MSTPPILRPSQKSILRYRGGKMGISAVPGAGKTFTLSALAAQIISSGALNIDQEVLIVTLVNSAVDNFANRISGMIEKRGLIPHLGYRVRTLHGLAHDIVREKPGLAGLEERFQIIDDREAETIRREAANAWLAANAQLLITNYVKEDLSEPQITHILNDTKYGLPPLLHSLALAFIRTAKNHRLTPEALRARLDEAPDLPLARMGCEIYADYQRALAYRGAVDFDDLIRLAYQILDSDEDYLARLQYRFPYVLEDEAQDSSHIQEEILRKIAPNWVRVGDPNQAIFETFTTADPQLLKDFIANEADKKEELPVSGRSQPFIIDLANQLIDWVAASHPEPACRDALSPPYIRAAAADDPQPNPEPDPDAIRIIATKYTPEQEVEAVAKSLEKWLPDHKDWTVAVLVPRNARGVDVVTELKKRKIDYIEIINSTNSTRMAAGALANILAYLADPSSPLKLSKAYQVWRRDWRDEESLRAVVLAAQQSDDEAEIAASGEALLAMTQKAAELLRKVGNVEDYIFPAGHSAELPFAFSDSEADLALKNELLDFRETIRRWQAATLLPIDQLLLTLAQEIFSNPADLALAHKLAIVLRQSAESHPAWRLPELTAELSVIAKNERRFIGFSEDDSGFDPEKHRGKVVVTTMHRAKGLEWDRVYLMSVNNYDFPSLQPYDSYISEKWFLRPAESGSSSVRSSSHEVYQDEGLPRPGLNLEAEALAQLRALLSSGEYDWYEEGAATLAARVDYTRERLRLLYVAITRAKRDLIITWNTGRKGEATPSLALQALAGWSKRP